MPDNMLSSSLRSQCQTIGKLKCLEQLQSGNSKRPRIQLGQEHLPHLHGRANISPMNKSVGIIQINDQTYGSSNHIIGIPSKSSHQICYSGSPTGAKNNYVFKRRSTTSAAHNQFHANNCSNDNMQPTLSSIDSHIQLSAGSTVNVNKAVTEGSCLAGTEPSVLVVNLGSKPPIPTKLIPLSGQPQTCIADTQIKRCVILPNNLPVCSDVVTGQQTNDSKAVSYNLVPHPSSVNPVSSQPDSNKLHLPYPCSINPSTNHSINQLDYSSHGPLNNERRASYTFKKMPVTCSYSQSSVRHLTCDKTNMLPTVNDKMLKNETHFNQSSQPFALKPCQNYITGEEQSCSQVSTFSSQIAGCYVALGSPGISSTALAQKAIIKDNPVGFRSQGYATTCSTVPLLLNRLSAESVIENGAVESSGCTSTSHGPTMNDSNASNVVELVGVSGLKNDKDVGELADGQGVVLPKVPKKSAAPRKPRKKSSKSSNETTVSTGQGESDVNSTSIGSTEAGRIAATSSTTKKNSTRKRAPKLASAEACVVKHSTTSDVATSDSATSSTTKKNSTRKRAPKLASAEACVVKHSTTSDVASDFSCEAPEVESDPLLVYFDLETTGLGYSHEITQISCVCPDVTQGGEFNVYTLPKGRFQPMASIITGLTKRGCSLYLHGEAVPTISLQEGLSQLVQWLDALPRRPLLVGHNSRRFDCPRLALALWNNNSLDLLHKNICGFSDSLPALRLLLPSRGEYKLESLLHEYCPNSTESSHNALDDCRALHSVLKEVVRSSTKVHNTSGSGTGIVGSPSTSATSASSQTASPGSATTVPGAPAAAAACSTTITTGSASQRLNVTQSMEECSEGDEVKSFETMVSEFEQDLIREGLNECLLKEYFSVQTVLETVRRSGPARAVMKSGGS